MLRPNTHKLTLYEVQEFTKELLWYIQSCENVEIDLSGIEQIDMSAIQLLISAKLYCQKENKAFKISNISDDIINLFSLTATLSILEVDHD